MISWSARTRLVLTLFWLAASLSPSVNPLTAFIPDSDAQESSVSGDAFFDLNDFSLGPDDEAALNDIAVRLKENPAETVIIEGYSDVTGDDEYNLNLSRRRADAVKQYYLGRGIGSGRIQVSGNGKTDNFATGTDEESLRLNRRVQVRVVPSRSEPSAPVEDASESVSAPEEELIEAVSVETTPGPQLRPAPAPAPLADVTTPPPALSQVVEKAMRSLASGRIMFDAPGQMNVGEPYSVEAVVSHKFLKDLSENINATDGKNNGVLTVSSNISLHLRGQGFDISPVRDAGEGEEGFPLDDTEDIKTVEEDSTAGWTWDVVPLESGYRSLVLDVEINVEDARYNRMAGEYPIFQKVVQVKPNIIHTLARSYLLMIVTIIIVVTIVGWILMKKLKLG